MKMICIAWAISVLHSFYKLLVAQLLQANEVSSFYKLSFLFAWKFSTISSAAPSAAKFSFKSDEFPRGANSLVPKMVGQER